LGCDAAGRKGKGAGGCAIFCLFVVQFCVWVVPGDSRNTSKEEEEEEEPKGIAAFRLQQRGRKDDGALILFGEGAGEGWKYVEHIQLRGRREAWKKKTEGISPADGMGFPSLLLCHCHCHGLTYLKN
jgi:hypothetical protein